MKNFEPMRILRNQADLGKLNAIWLFDPAQNAYDGPEYCQIQTPTKPLQATQRVKTLFAAHCFCISIPNSHKAATQTAIIR